jgi:hypothetical protein
VCETRRKAGNEESLKETSKEVNFLDNSSDDNMEKDKVPKGKWFKKE